MAKLDEIEKRKLPIRSAGVSRRLTFRVLSPENKVTAYNRSFWKLQLDNKGGPTRSETKKKARNP